MAYSYGDGTQSTLESNYLEFLKDVLDFAVEVMMSDHRARTCQEGAAARKEKAEAELDRLKFLSHTITKALDEATGGAPDSIANRCAQSVRQAATEAIKKSAAQVKSVLGNEIQQIGQKVQQERGSSTKALESLLLKHDLPDSIHRVNLKLQDGAHYIARLAGRADCKVEWVIDLDIPGDSIFSNIIRIDRLMPNLEIKVPEKGGLVRKTMRLKSQALTKKYITELIHAADQTTIKMRTGPTDGEGFDVVIGRKPRVRLIRVGKSGETTAPFEPLEEDSGKMLELYQQLTSEAQKLAKSRKLLVEARLDGKTLADHEKPAVLVSRLIQRMAPQVQEIARHSLSPKELVLKQVLGNNRREEVFVAKAELMKKIEPVPASLRGVFAPLGLGDLESGGAVPAMQSSPVATAPTEQVPAFDEAETRAKLGPAATLTGPAMVQTEVAGSVSLPDPPMRAPERLPATISDGDQSREAVTKVNKTPAPELNNPGGNGQPQGSGPQARIENSIDIALAELESEQK